MCRGGPDCRDGSGEAETQLYRTHDEPRLRRCRVHTSAAPAAFLRGSMETETSGASASLVA